MEPEIPIAFGQGRFVVEREIGRGGMGVVYEAFDKEREMSVALKTLLHMDDDNLYHFKREFRALHDIVHPNLCALMELIKDEKTWFLTMELIHGADFLSYVRGASPGEKLFCPGGRTNFDADLVSNTFQPRAPEKVDEAQPHSFDEHRLRKCLASLCVGLNALHAAGKVHRDIKPSNVMITADDRVVLLDFGLIAEKGTPEKWNLGNMVGSAAYMAPEQADGEMIGPEADMYSVGVMLYEALAGKLPFDGNPNKLILDKQLSDPVRPGDKKAGLPEDLEILCMDLLVRDTEARPSAVDTLDILEGKRPSPVPCVNIATKKDAEKRFFVGRETELRSLWDSYDEIIAERCFRAVVIEGVSGVGKSALVEKFETDLISENASTVVLKSRCYERESAPFKAFDGVVETLIDLIQNTSGDEALELTPRNTELLIRLFPALKRTKPFSKRRFSEVEIADPHVLQDRSFEAFIEVLSRLSRQHPLVVVIDDMQWADADSFLLLKRIVKESDAPPLLLVLLSRFAKDDEDSALDWDTLFPTTHKRIGLETLVASDSEELVRFVIDQQHHSLDLDAKTIAGEAAGHPLYITELIQTIASGGEEWKNARLDEVIWNRVKTLPEVARQLLRILCVAGTPTEQGHLHNLFRISSEEFYKNIAVLRTANLVRSRGPGSHDLIEPYHDRVREAVVAHDISIGEAMMIHLEIGRYYLKAYKDENLDRNLFFVAQHYFEGKDLIVEQGEQIRLAELLFLAGKKARSSAAFVSAMVYYKESIELFADKDWDTHYNTMFELYCSAAESAYVTDDFLLASDLVNIAKTQARSILDKAKIYETYVLSLIADGKPLEAIDTSIEILRKLGVKMPHRPSKFYLLRKIIATKFRLFGKTRDQLINRPQLTDPHTIAAGQLMNQISSSAYTELPNLNALIVIVAIEISLDHGISDLSGMAFAGWGFVNAALLKNYQEGHKYGRISLDLLSQIENQSKTPLTLAIWANLIQHWKEHIRNTLPYLLRCHEVAYKIGDIPYLALSGPFFCYNSFLAGVYLPELVKKFDYYGNEMKDKQQDIAYNMHCIVFQTTLNLMSPSQDSTKLIGSVYDETEMVPHHIEKEQSVNLSTYHFCKLVLQVFFNSYKDAHGEALEAGKYAAIHRGTVRSAVTPFYDSLTGLKYHAEADTRTKRKLLRRVRKNQRKYKKIARSSPANHAHKYTLVEAERARVKRKFKKAPALYDEAIAGAIEQEFTQDAALACEFAADFYREICDPDKTMTYARDALAHYEKWGAFAKVEHVKEKFGIE